MKQRYAILKRPVSRCHDFLLWMCSRKIHSDNFSFASLSVPSCALQQSSAVVSEQRQVENFIRKEFNKNVSFVFSKFMFFVVSELRETEGILSVSGSVDTFFSDVLLQLHRKFSQHNIEIPILYMERTRNNIHTHTYICIYSMRMHSQPFVSSLCVFCTLSTSSSTLKCIQQFTYAECLLSNYTL